MTGSIYDESRCNDETSIPESWRVRAGVGYVTLEDDEDIEAIDEGEDSCRLLPAALVPYDKSGQKSSLFSGSDDGEVRAPPTSPIDMLLKESIESWR